MLQQIPLKTTSNQTLQMILQINGVNTSLIFKVRWNAIAGYWVLTIIKSSDGTIIIDSIPLVTGEKNTETLNILKQYGYLLIGEAYLVPAVAQPTSNYPNDKNLGTEFVLIWQDNL
jgi:hypothetical protein